MGNVPAEVSGFVGRVREVRGARRLLRSSRLVSLVGVGGVGKTRLALRFAMEVARVFSAGVWFVEFADLPVEGGPGLVEQTVAAALGLVGISARRPGEALVEHLRDRHCLLVLDNCEHVVGDVGAVATELLRGAPGVHVLVTSREPLGCDGEQVVRVSPLSVSDADGTPGGDALRLLVWRAEAAGAPVPGESLAAAAELARRLDGIPLAIELAAARLTTLSVEELLGRVDERFRLLTDGPRHGRSAHRTLRRAVDWSYQLCGPAERLLWQRVSVFAGGFDLAAAEQVCADIKAADGEEPDRVITPDEVLDLLTGLVRRSVLLADRRPGSVRYRMLETLRQYGLAALAEQGDEEEMRRRHRDYYQRMAAAGAWEWFGTEELAWLQWARNELPNLRAAMCYGLARDQADASLEMAVNLTRLHLWFFVGWPDEGRGWLRRALDRVPDGSGEPLRLMASALARWLGAWCPDARPRTADELLAESLRPNLDDKSGSSFKMRFSSYVHALYLESDPRSFGMLAGLRQEMRDAGAPPSDVAVVGLQWALSASFFAEPGVALDVCRQHLDDVTRHQAAWSTSWAQCAMGLAHLRYGDPLQGLTLAREALRRQHGMGDRWGAMLSVYEVAWSQAAALAGYDERDKLAVARLAARTIGGAQRLREDIGVRGGGGSGPFPAETVRAHHAIVDVLGEEAYRREFEHGMLPCHAPDAAYQSICSLALDQPATGGGRAAELTPVDTVEHTPASDARLTAREQEIARLVARGLSNPQIAKDLVISLRTAQTHVTNILRKLALRNRQEIAVWYVHLHDPEP